MFTQESLGPASLPPGQMIRNLLGEPPAQPAPLTSKPHVNNLQLPALRTSQRDVFGGRGWDAEQALKAAPPPAQPQPKDWLAQR